MNFLAHLLLSGDHPEQHVGAVLGDFLRGVDRTSLPPILQQSVTHHLAVDSFTDSHEMIHKLKRTFSPERQRFAGIIIDVTFDHFLIKHWEEFSDLSIGESIDIYHESLRTFQQDQPPRMKHVVDLMITHHVLRSYESISGVGTALNRVADRLSRKTKLYNSLPEIKKNYNEIELCFCEFFPILNSCFRDGNT